MKIHFIILSLFFTGAWATDGHRQHNAHVHGHAVMNLAISGMELELELETPAMNLLGFEHHPESASDKMVFDKTLAFINQPSNWIELSTSANCTLQQTSIESALIEKTGHAEHADFEIAVTYRCLKPEHLKQVNLQRLFQEFPSLEEIDAQWLTDHKQSATELNGKQTIISLQ